ncbi:MAG: hypothetical protein GWO19_05595, partial [Nitrospinaceae bacterium]|nr:hypothetical protein [Nitrospinaceae bacterium]NIU95736.1 hypothetical protein [Nitrospinaceae bacterium]
WRYRIAEKIREILNKHPAKRDFDPDGVADFFHVVFEGAIIFSKTFQDPRAVSTHFKHYRNYLELLFGVEA